MNQQIIIYTKNTCPSCNQVKFALGAAGVKYDIRNIEESQEYKDELMLLGYSSVPVTIFYKEDGSKKILSGFDYGEFAQELGL